MILNLKNTQFKPDGVFGELKIDTELICYTLQHAYFDPQKNIFFPKLPNGAYTCKRGQHQLERGPVFETFEVLNVPEHTGILFHVGNFNDDSKGCILCGASIAGDFKALNNSKIAFDKFLRATYGEEQFTLVVS